MFKLANWFGVIESNKTNQHKTIWEKIKSFFGYKKADQKVNISAKPDNVKPPFRWKRLMAVLIIGSIIGLLIYFIGFYGRALVVNPTSFSVANNSLTLTDNNQTSYNVQLDRERGPQAELTEPTLRKITITTPSNRGNIAFSVFYGSDAKNIWYDIGNYRLLYDIETQKITQSFPTLVATTPAPNVPADPNVGTTPNALVDNTAALRPLYQYLNLAKNTAAVPQPNIFLTIFLQFLPFVIYIVIFLLFMRYLAKAQGGVGGQDSIFGVGKSSAKNVKTNITFKDVAGIKEEKEELMEIVDYLKHPSKYSAMGARAPRGVVLYGPPGTGKTLLAKAVSGEAHVPFFEVSGASFDDMFVGVGAKRVRDLFTRAKKAAPCIVFIDEIDAVASKRGNRVVNGGNSGIADQTINQLLSELDGFNTASGIVVMAATNRLDTLDDAILRPGRFDRHIQVNLPDIKERKEILLIHSNNKNLSSKVNLEDIARRTPGFSGAQLENVLNEATLLAVRHKRNTITTEDIDEAIDRVIAGPAKKSRIITMSERRKVAYHEAGHAVAGLHVQKGEVVEKITIIPRGQAGGYTLSAPVEQEVMLKSKEDLLAIITTALAGRAAEEVIFGPSEITSGASNDLYKVSNIARAMVTQLGMSKLGLTQFIPSEGEQNPYVKQYSDITAKAIDEEIDTIINQQYELAKKIIRENDQELQLIVECLLLMETIVREQINYIHKHKKLPEEAVKIKLQLEKEKVSKKLN